MSEQQLSPNSITEMASRYDRGRVLHCVLDHICRLHLSCHRHIHCHSQSAELPVKVQRQYNASTVLYSPECWRRAHSHYLRASLVN
jgi:hypothetical protein